MFWSTFCYLWKILLKEPSSEPLGFLGGSVVNNLPANAGDAGDVGLIPGLGRSPGEGNGHPLQYSCWENPAVRGAWLTTVHSVAEADVTERQSTACFRTIRENCLNYFGQSSRAQSRQNGVNSLIREESCLNEVY